MHNVKKVPSGLMPLITAPYKVFVDVPNMRVYVDNQCWTYDEIIDYANLAIPTKGYRGYALCKLPDSKLKFIRSKLLYKGGFGD